VQFKLNTQTYLLNNQLNFENTFNIGQESLAPYLINTKTINPDPIKAFYFYKEHILKAVEYLSPLLERHHLKKKVRVPSWKWELFSAILFGDTAENAIYTDLSNHEVKSAKEKSAFEYLYYRKKWKGKLHKEMNINHVYISYQIGFKDIDVRLVRGQQIADIFKSWEPEIEEFYSIKKKKRRSPRIRKNVSFKTVKKTGKLMFKIRNGVDIEWDAFNQ